MNRDQTIFFIS